jgi:hypothetical protein
VQRDGVRVAERVDERRVQQRGHAAAVARARARGQAARRARARGLRQALHHQVALLLQAARKTERSIQRRDN